jgi:hypothetical protein
LSSGTTISAKDSAVAVLLGNISLALRLAVEPDRAVVDAQPVSGQGDDALDVALLRIARIVEDHHVAALDGREV